MHIYQDEKPLEELILANKTTAMVVKFKITEEKPDILLNSLKTLDQSGNKAFAKVLAEVADHPDLMYGSAILVSTTLNRNDDMFLPQYTWEARYTPINTPFNDQHQDKQIIGHIIDARPVDKEGKPIKGDKVPDYFDIEADFVVYKDVYPDKAKEIAEGAVDGTKFVSMEAKLTAFDYGFIDEQNEMDIVARNEKTSFLTKYLRAYGGTGEFQGRKIVRVLKDFRFSGMGNVDDPANLRSEYTKITNLDGIEGYTKANFNITKGNVMTLEQALAKIEELEAQVKKNESDAVKAQVDKLAAEKTEVQNALATANSKVEVAEQKLASVQKELDTAKADLEKATTDLKAKTDELTKIANESRLAARVAKLSEFGFAVADDKKEKYATMTDEAFAELVDFAQTIAKKDDKKKKEDDEEDKKDGGKDEDKEKAAKKDKEKKDEEKAKKEAEAALAAAQPNVTTDPTATAGGTDTSVEIKTVAEKLAAAVIKKREKHNIKK